MIRLKNLDLNTDALKHIEQSEVDFAISDTRRCVFVAPFAGTLDHIDLHANSTGSTTILATLGDSTVALAAAIANISATSFARIRITPSANNSLSTGSPVVLNLSATAAINVRVVCTFTPAKHRESR